MQVSEAGAASKSGPGRWSKKEILGHLIDSAGNNHQRFVRAQLTPRLETPGYEQMAWVASQSYITESWADLIELWSAYNRHLLHVVKAMPDAVLKNEVVIGTNSPATLEAVVIDYVRHLNHHLGQIVG
jgi:hypothetical protein